MSSQSVSNNTWLITSEEELNSAIVLIHLIFILQMLEWFCLTLRKSSIIHSFGSDSSFSCAVCVPPPKAKPVSLSLSVCLTSLITTWRNVHYFSSPFVSEPLLEEQEGEGVRSYSLAPPWHKSRLIIMLKLPGILKWREREKESGSKHSGNLNQLCKLHFSGRKKLFFVFSFLITGLFLVICKCSHTLILSANKHSSRFRKRKP